MNDVRDRVFVGSTRLGRGVFAFRPFAAEEVIAEIHGRVIDDPDYSSVYGMDLGGSLTLDPDPPFRFLNHSCEPNCELFQWAGDAEEENGENGSCGLWLAALRPIEPGEELTIDYAWPAEAAIPCRCNARNCRGWIVDVAELPRLQETAPTNTKGVAK